MRRKMLLATALGLALSAPAAAKPAQLAQADANVLPPYEIVTIVRSAHLNPVDRPVRRGPNYVLRAIDLEGDEMRVVVDARYGDIVSVTPLVPADAVQPGALRPPGYIVAPPPGVYEADEPPVIYQEDAPVYRGPPRPNTDIPVTAHAPYRQPAPPSVASAPLPPPGGSPPSAEPRDIMAPERGGEGGLLPPPPERFPQRVPPPSAKPAPAAKPAPKRAASAASAAPPLPRPKPPARSATQSGAAPAPPPTPDSKRNGEPLPH